MKYTVN